jgi:SAM-dependent methyltransferase
MTSEMRQLQRPPADEYGFVKTLNNQGFMTNYLDEFSEEFVSFAPQAPGPALDIGAAYGVAAIAALDSGATVFANDIDSRHLELLRQEVIERIPTLNMDKLNLITGKFPEDLEFAPRSLGAVLACRVFHFFDGPTITRGLKKIHEWLAPGGKFFLVCETPYVNGLQTFWPIYEERVLSGEFWPGFIEDFKSIDPSRAKDLPTSLHLFEPFVLCRALTEAGFKVERSNTIARPNFPPGLRLDGRESVGIVGVK